jgi:hypothetical protein
MQRELLGTQKRKEKHVTQQDRKKQICLGEDTNISGLKYVACSTLDSSSNRKSKTNSSDRRTSPKSYLHIRLCTKHFFLDNKRAMSMLHQRQGPPGKSL